MNRNWLFTGHICGYLHCLISLTCNFSLIRLTVAKVQILPEIQMSNPFEMMRLQSLDKLSLPDSKEVTSHEAVQRDLSKGT